MSKIATINYSYTPMPTRTPGTKKKQDKQERDISTTSANPTKTTIDRLILSPEKSHIIFQYSQSSSNDSKKRHTIVFDTKSLYRDLLPIQIPAEVSGQIESRSPYYRNSN